MKNALKNIDPKESLNEREHIDKIKRHILEIGDKINDHLTAYSDPEKIKEWRNYLWVFVSKFTSSWSWERIRNLYKKFANSRDDELYNNKPPMSLLGSAGQSQSFSSGAGKSSFQSGTYDRRDQTSSSSSNFHKYEKLVFWEGF